MNRNQLIPGAYYRYTPQERHCHEGIFLVREGGSGVPIPCDTFWGPDGAGASFGWRLSDDEIASAELLFDPSDGWKPADRYAPIDDYEADDIRTVTSQQGLQQTHWIRTGATPSMAKKIANAREAVEKARHGLDSAVSSLEFASMALQRLICESEQGSRAGTGSAAKEHTC